MNVNFRHLIYQLLPPNKRQPVRVRWLTALFSPLTGLWQSFQAWRNESRMLINVNSQTAVLEGFLRNLYHEPTAIKIESYADGLLWVSLSSESEERQVDIDWVVTDGAQDVPLVPLANELRNKFADADFVVFIPSRLDKTLVAAKIDKYKQALINYKIIQA